MQGVNGILTKQIDKNKTPSVQYYIFNRDSILHKFVGGFSNLVDKTQTTESTTYHAFSVTKTFTALAVLQLAEQGRINIDLPIVTYLRAFPYSTEITTRQLLSHSSGVPNPLPLSWVHLREEHEHFDRDAFFEQRLSDNRKIKSKPNEKFGYSNLGYVILGQLIEEVAGVNYEEYVLLNIIEPLGLEEDQLNFAISDIRPHAIGYHNRYSLSSMVLGLMIDKSKLMDISVGKWRSFKEFYVNGASYGGLIATPNALVKYVQELLKPNSKLISEEFKQLLFVENHTNNGKPTGMCLSWFRGQLNGNNYYSHAGGGGGYYCEIRIYPDKEVGSVIMFNRTGMSDERYLDKLDKHVIK